MDPRPDGDATRPDAGPSRRALLGGGLAAGALAWAAPTIISVPAAVSAATVAPGIVIDAFTIPDAVSDDGDSTLAIDPIGAVPVTRGIRTVLTGAQLAVQFGAANFAGPTGSVGQFDYVFGAPLDLSSCTSLTAPTIIAGAVEFRLFIDFQGGSSFIVDPTTVQPELRFDLSGFTPLQLAATVSFTLRLGATTAATAQLGPLTAS